MSLNAVAGSILDAAPAGDGVVNGYGASARFTAGVAVGQVTPANALETEVMTVSVLAGNGGVNVQDASGLAVGTVGTVPGNRVQGDGTMVGIADGASQTGVVKGAGGQVIVRTGDGSNVVNFPAFAVMTVLTTTSVPRSDTGLHEQVVRITNTTASSMDAVRVWIRDLPAGVSVVNATGSEGGVPYIQYNWALGVNQSVDLTIEYYVPSGSSIPTGVTFGVEVVAALPPVNLVGNVVAVVNVTRTYDNRYLLQFQSQAGFSYQVQYSNDGLTWTGVRPLLTGTGGYLTWLDNGPAKTESDSSTVAIRYYRVIVSNAI